MVENLIIIGTSHIARESIERVKKVIEDSRPDIVAIELDVGRAHALFAKEKKVRFGDVMKVGFKGFLFSIIGAYVEKKLGEKVGTSPGGEMKAAVLTAKKIGARIAFIDQDISVTLRRFSKVLTWSEKWRLVRDLIGGVFGFGEKIPFDLSRVPEKELISRLTREVRKKYPNVYKVLVAERNLFMARNLASIIRQAPQAKIVAVVGAGHETAIESILARLLQKT